MKFTSGQVSGFIQHEVWPILRTAGFDQFTGRNAWRRSKDVVEVINFQSFNSYLANALGCTTFSFAINLGVYYLCHHRTPWRAKLRYSTAPNTPLESACHARLHLKKRITQPQFPRSDVWFIQSDGSNLEDAGNDAFDTIKDVGLPWLTTFRSLPYALSTCFISPESGTDQYIGAYGSLNAAEVGSAIALELNDFESAKKLWLAVAHSGYYARMPETIKRALKLVSIIEQLKA